MVGQNINKSKFQKNTLFNFISCDVKIYLHKTNVYHSAFENQNMIEIIYNFYEICNIY